MVILLFRSPYKVFLGTPPLLLFQMTSQNGRKHSKTSNCSSYI